MTPGGRSWEKQERKTEEGLWRDTWSPERLANEPDARLDEERETQETPSTERTF